MVIAATISVACASDDAQPTAGETSQDVSQPVQQAAQQPAQQPAPPQQPAVQSDEQLEAQSAEPESGQPEPQQTEPAQTQDESAEAAPPLTPSEDAIPAPSLSVEAAGRYVEYLAGELGPRTTGTEQERAAAAYMAETFERLGYVVEVQEFSYTVRFSVGRIDLDDGSSTLAFRFTGSGDQAVSGVLVDVPGFGEPADFESVDALGKVAIVNRGAIEFHAKAVNAEAAGAVALIVVNRFDNESLGGTFGPNTSQIPVLQITREAGDALRGRLLETATIPASAPRSGESQNVIARKPDGACRVVVGGHYDTVPEVSGANDNASGTALTLALAEAWTDHPAAADICFVGFGAEEQGLHGSVAFVRSLRESATLDRVSAMLNLDAIGDGRAPYHIIASSELQSLADAVASELQIFAGGGSLPMMLGSDHSSFHSAGVPVVFVFPPGATLHTPLDNLANFNHEVFEDIAVLNHGILACLLLRAGSPVRPDTSCGE